jgi:hypothetical protein
MIMVRCSNLDKALVDNKSWRVEQFFFVSVSNHHPQSETEGDNCNSVSHCSSGFLSSLYSVLSKGQADHRHLWVHCWHKTLVLARVGKCKLERMCTFTFSHITRVISQHTSDFRDYLLYQKVNTVRIMCFDSQCEWHAVSKAFEECSDNIQMTKINSFTLCNNYRNSPA